MDIVYIEPESVICDAHFVYDDVHGAAESREMRLVRFFCEVLLRIPLKLPLVIIIIYRNEDDDGEAST